MAESRGKIMTSVEENVIREFHAGIVKAVEEAEKEHEADKRNGKKREVYRFVSAQEIAISDLCAELGLAL